MQSHKAYLSLPDLHWQLSKNKEPFTKIWAFLVAQTVKRLPTMRETQVRSLGREDPLEKWMATHSSILAWKIPWTEEPGRLQSLGSQRVQHHLATKPPIRISKGCNPTQKWQMGVTEKRVQDLKVSFTICFILPSAFLRDQIENLSKVLDIFVPTGSLKHCTGTRNTASLSF